MIYDGFSTMYLDATTNGTQQTPCVRGGDKYKCIVNYHNKTAATHPANSDVWKDYIHGKTSKSNKRGSHNKISEFANFYKKEIQD